MRWVVFTWLVGGRGLKISAKHAPLQIASVRQEPRILNSRFDWLDRL